MSYITPLDRNCLKPLHDLIFMLRNSSLRSYLVYSHFYILCWNVFRHKTKDDGSHV